jgi:hypothetical protein
MTALAGMDKEMRAIVQDAVQRGWLAKPTSNGHLLMRHPNGGTAMVAPKRGSYRNIRNARAQIGRVEREGEAMAVQPIVQEDDGDGDAPVWELGASSKGRFDRRPNGGGGYQYRCTECGTELSTWQQAGWHYRRTHKTTTERYIEVAPTEAEPQVVGWQPVEPATGTLAERIAALVEQELAELVHLRTENARLKDTLAALASLAADA